MRNVNLSWSVAVALAGSVGALSFADAGTLEQREDTTVAAQATASSLVRQGAVSGPGVLPNAERTIFLARTAAATQTPMNVAYHPGFRQYYASNGGNPAFPAFVYDAAGNRIQDIEPLGIDVRAWNYNPGTGLLEVLSFDAQNGDGGNVRGLIRPGVDGAGRLTGTTANLLAALPGLISSQTMPAYDPADNVFYSRDQTNRVNVASRSTGNLVTTIDLDFAAAGVADGDVTVFPIGFDRAQRCLVVVDATNDRALVFDRDGTFLGASQLDVPGPANYRVGYTNGQLFVFDDQRNGWQGFRIKSGDPCADCPCPEDINRDGTVDFADILRILAAWGPCEEACDDCEDGFVDRCGGTDDCLECQTPDGRCLCTFGALFGCSEFEPCRDGDCPPGFFCCVNTCCPEPICMALCEADVPQFERAQPGELTPTGIMRSTAATFDRNATALGAMMEFGPQRRRDVETAAGPQDLVGEPRSTIVAQSEFDYDDPSAGSPLAASGTRNVIDLDGIIRTQQSGAIVLDSTFPGRGWFNDVGFHTATNDNTFTGTVNPDPLIGGGRGLNSFYVYDVSSLAGLEVISAAIRFQQDDFFSQDSSERIGVYDVSTSRADLEADYLRNDPTGIAIHGDLQTGNRYGLFSATPGQGNVYNTALDAQAVADINAAIGSTGDFSIALHNETDSGVRQDGVRFDTTPRVHQLILEAVPARDDKWCNGPYDCEIDTCYFSNRNSDVNSFVRYDDFVCTESSLVGDFEFIAGGWLSGPCDLLSNLAAVEITIYDWRADELCGWAPGARICTNVIPVEDMDIQRFCIDQFGIQQYTFNGRFPELCRLAPGQYAISIAGVLRDPNGCFMCLGATSTPRRCVGYSVDRNTGEGCTDPQDVFFCLDSVDPCDDCPCPEDINRDGTVDFADILRVLAAWGPCPGDCDDCEDGLVEICDDEGECLDCITPTGECLCAFGVNSSCSDWQVCNDGRCPPGFFCCVNTCCAEPICLPLCEAAPAEYERAQPGELTPTGIMTR